MRGLEVGRACVAAVGRARLRARVRQARPHLQPDQAPPARQAAAAGGWQAL